MRKNGTLYYLLGGHLGSTSTVTFENGNLVSQTKYKAWGEVRYQSGPSLTEYGFTGQFGYTGSFGLIYFNARWLDVSLGRFAQADSIVPPGVQGLDRYSYVNNSPMNYVDPSGHFICSNDRNSDDYCPGKSSSFTVVSGGGGKGKGGGDEAESDSIIEGTVEIISDVTTKIYDDWVTLEAKCAETGHSGMLNNTSCLDYYSVLSQDMATASSFFGATVTTGSTLIGCAIGSESGVLAGCAGGYAIGKAMHVDIFNFLETGFSAISLVTTWQSDNLTGDNKSFLDLGEDSKTSVVTFSIGLVTSNPYLDLAIDFYSSGYNHGYFCGVSTILECFP